MGHWGGKTKGNVSGTCEIKSFPNKEAIQKPHFPETTVTHHGGLQIPKSCWEHYTGQLNMGCRHALLSDPAATHRLHHISPCWLWGGPSWETERNPADTLPVSFEETPSTSLSSQGEVSACKGRGNPPPCGGELHPRLGRVCEVSLCSLRSNVKQLLLSHPLAAYHPHEVPGSPTRSSASPPFTHCKERQQQLNCLFYNPSSLYGNGIDHSSPLLV